MNPAMRRTAATLILALLCSLPIWASSIVHLPLDGAIHPISRDFIVRGLAQAHEAGAAVVIIELDTPGGLETSMRDIVAAELASTVPVVVFVAPAGARAASAGVFLTLAADLAAMAPGTNIGAAHPVQLIGTTPSEDGATDPSLDKAASDAAAFARSLAEQRGRNVVWAEAAVLESSSLSAREALDAGVIDLLANDLDDLVAKLDGRTLANGHVLTVAGLPVTTVRPNLRERLLGLLADPNLVYVLFILGIYGLIYEFFQPGVGLGLALGGICLLLALFGLQVLPVNVTGLVLVLFGIALIVLDAFTPTNGILTLGGVASLAVGSLTLFDIADRQIGLSLATVVPVIAVTTALFVFVISKALLIQRKEPASGERALIGRIGDVRRDLDPEGTVFVNGEYWNARSIDEPISAGARVRVERIAGGTLYVRRV